MTQHVVVVDDAEPNLSILTAIVGNRDKTQVHPFDSSRAAIAFAHAHEVDAFVLDYHMPEPDGRAMIRLLRDDPRYRYVPIVIVTAEHERENRLDALAAGANDFIVRPIEPRELTARLDTLLALHAARRHLSENVDLLEHSLRLQEQHAREQADRMVALWRIVTNSELASDDMSLAILMEGARAIRPDTPFFGTLRRLEDGDLVTEADTRAMLIRRGDTLRGHRIAIGETLESLLTDCPATLVFDDVREAPAARRLPEVRRRRCRSAISTAFFAGHAVYYLEFWSRDPVEMPFTAEDRTYVELLANFFGARVQQAWQFDRIAYHLSHDTLTGLRNRTRFRLDARAALAAAGSGSMAIVSLDRFRQINEQFGHVIGDALLVEVGAALARSASDGEIVARLAGDTFGVFLAGVDQGADARTRTVALTEFFARPFSTGDREGKHFVRLGASVGVAASGKEPSSIDALLSHADTAVVVARRNGRGRVVVYEAGMESAESERDRRLAELSLAIEREEFVLHFQPHADLSNDRISGAEALIRWNHPTRGLLPPSTFIPFAEEHGLIRTISAWVMGSALRAASTLRVLDPTFRVWFNLSAHDLSDHAIVDAFRDAAAGGAPISNVGVELTETAALVDMGTTAQTVKTLQQLDVRVAIDDFGTGYSSLSLLKRLPVDVLKIDRSFVSEVLLEERDAVIAEGLIGFGDRFGFATLAEGVETAEQLAWLRAHGCGFAQGYGIARPLPLEDLVAWLTSRELPAPHIAKTSRGAGPVRV